MNQSTVHIFGEACARKSGKTFFTQNTESFRYVLCSYIGAKQQFSALKIFFREQLNGSNKGHVRVDWRLKQVNAPKGTLTVLAIVGKVANHVHKIWASCTSYAQDLGKLHGTRFYIDLSLACYLINLICFVFWGVSKTALRLEFFCVFWTEIWLFWRG